MAVASFARRTRAERAPALWLFGGAAILAVAVASAALASAAGLLPMPFRLLLLAERLPVTFAVHMAASGLGLLLLPVVIAAPRGGRLHRRFGAVAAIAFAIGGLASLPSALASEAGPIARAGFLSQGVVALGFLANGILAARRRCWPAHRAAMTRAAAVFAGAIVLRLMLVVVALAGLPFDASYDAVAWASWLLPLVAVEGVRRGAGDRTGRTVHP